MLALLLQEFDCFLFHPLPYNVDLDIPVKAVGKKKKPLEKIVGKGENATYCISLFEALFYFVVCK